MSPLDQDIETVERSIGELLVERGRLDARGLERAMRVLAESDEGLPQLLSKLGLVSERDVADAIAQRLGLPQVTARDYPTVALLEDKVSPRFLGDSLVLPLAQERDGIALAMANPLDRYAIEAIQLVAGQPVLPRVAIPGELEGAIDRLYGRNGSAIEPMSDGPSPDGTVEYDVERLKDQASEAPVIRTVNQLIAKAVECRASDIHIEPTEDHLRVRYRIDGALRDVEPPPARLRAAIISRIKIMARLNIAERRLPQDGRIKLTIHGTPVDFRISITPMMHGEGIVVRVLDRSSVTLDFAALGITGPDLKTYLGVLERPNGVLLVTGPTGSGKTTTLYTSLVRLNAPDKNIVTIEDPIEYQLEGINQIQVKPSIGLDFANILRSVLRHDPDIIMVGEIRDVETAKIAIQSALTGHLVLSTLHTNNATSSITRLLDMGVEDYLLTSTLNGVVGQRLVRTLCEKCRERYRPLPELVDQLGLRRYTSMPDVVLYRPVGCDECQGTGFRGRTSIFETLVLTDGIRRLVLQRAASHELQRAAIREGMHTMFDDGMVKALAGTTTVEEVLQVTRDTEDTPSTAQDRRSAPDPASKLTLIIDDSGAGHGRHATATAEDQALPAMKPVSSLSGGA